MLGPHHVIVKFGDAIKPDDQGPAMLALERMLREKGIPAEVYKETAADDSRLRIGMTDEKRKTL